MFQPKVLKFNGGYLTYSLKNRSVDLSQRFEDAYIFTTEENYQQIEENIECYSSGYPCGFDSEKDEWDWQNAEWMNVEIQVKRSR